MKDRKTVELNSYKGKGKYVYIFFFKFCIINKVIKPGKLMEFLKTYL